MSSVLVLHPEYHDEHYLGLPARPTHINVSKDAHRRTRMIVTSTTFKMRTHEYNFLETCHP